MIIQIPTHCTFHQWFIDLNRTIPNIVVPTPLPGDTNWWKYAMLLISNNQTNLPIIPLPTKLKFPYHRDWRKWAFSFIQSVSN